MAEFSKLVVTRKGQALIAKMLAGTATDIDFTKVAASDASYSVDELEGLESLSAIMQESEISRKTRTNEVAVKVETAFSNTDLTVGYHMRTLGLYANDPDEGEILYAACVETSGNCYMPPYNGITVSGAYIQLITTVGNAENVHLEVNPGAVATVGDIINLQNEINKLKASPVKRTVRLEASGLQNYLDRLPRLLTEYLTLEVSGELSSAVEIRDFYGPGNLTVVSSSGGFTSRGIRVTHCSVFVYLKNIAFQEREDMTPNDALLDVQHCGHFVQVVYCGFTGLGGAGRCIGVQAAYGSRVEMGNCLASGLGVVVQAARGSIITADGDSSSYEDNAVGAYVWHGGIVLLTSPVPDTLGAPANKKYGGLIAKTDGTLL